MKALVDILMCTYNHEKYIAKAIESVLMQDTEFDIRLIIGEDFSTDGTREIVKKYASMYPDKITAILQPKNVGVNENAKSVFNNTEVEYSAFLDGDDYWTDEHKLQKQVEFLESNDEYVMCFTDSIIVDQEGVIKKDNRVDERNRREITQRDILNGFVPPTNTVLMRTKYLQSILADSPNYNNGDYYISMLMAKYGKIGYLNYNTAAYRIHEGSSWAKMDEHKRRINYTRTLMSLKGKLQEENENVLDGIIKSNLSSLNELSMKEDYTENGYWTPQTAMLRSIRDAVLKIDGTPQTALSIDNNPAIEKMLLLKWPSLEITKTQWPEYDAQDLHQFNNESFDIVFSHQVLEHIPKPWLAASEMNRVLKHGGIGIHSSCAYNPRHGYPAFKDYYRFLPDGLAELFDGVNIWVKEGWGSKEALIYNLTIDDGHGQLGGRRFVEALGEKNDENYPWHTWVIFQKK